MPKPSDLLQGTLDLLILKTLSREPLHGWGIAKRMLELSDDVLTVQQGSLYPALHRLEQQGWIKAEWKDSKHGRERQVLRADARRPPAARARAHQLEAPVVGGRSAAQERLRRRDGPAAASRLAPATAIARPQGRGRHRAPSRAGLSFRRTRRREDRARACRRTMRDGRRIARSATSPRSRNPAATNAA